MKGFIDFIKEQGVFGLAIGFLLGGAVSKLVTSLVTDIVNPILGIALGKAQNLSSAYIKIGSAKILWGHFVTTMIDFIVIATIIYLAMKTLNIKKSDSHKK